MEDEEVELPIKEINEMSSTLVENVLFKVDPIEK